MRIGVNNQDLEIRLADAKKLNSGKCQVKFYIHEQQMEKLYGYLLVEANTSWTDVTTEICKRLYAIENQKFYYDIGLAMKGKLNILQDGFVLFKL